MTLINDDHYAEYSQSHSEPIVGIVNSESTKHDRVHCRANAFRYLALIIIAVAYLSYGLTKYFQSSIYPLTKYYDDTFDAYPLPATLACVDYKEDEVFFDVLEFDIMTQMTLPDL